MGRGWWIRAMFDVCFSVWLVSLLSYSCFERRWWELICNSDCRCTTFDETDRGADGVDKGICSQKRVALSDIKVGPGKHVRVAQGDCHEGNTRRVSKLGSKAE